MRKTTITIKRTNGEVEVIDVSEKFAQGLTDQMFYRIKKATKLAGNGECLSYKMEDILSEETLKEISEHNKKVAEHNKKVAWFVKNGFEASQVR